MFFIKWLKFNFLSFNVHKINLSITINVKIFLIFAL
jgi:hypothetical protein